LPSSGSAGYRTLRRETGELPAGIVCRRNLLQQDDGNCGIHFLNLRDRATNWFTEINAGIAQLVEQLICNQQVVGSNPTAGSSLRSERSEERRLSHAGVKRRRASVTVPSVAALPGYGLAGSSIFDFGFSTPKAFACSQLPSELRIESSRGFANAQAHAQIKL
jgi:hypothetical protein